MQFIRGLKLDYIAGEGDVKLPKKFLEQNSLFKMDVLKDWIEILTQLYNQTHEEWTSEMENSKK